MTVHAPSSPAQPFAIGLKPLQSDDFLIVDDNLATYVLQKRDLYTHQFSDVFMAQNDTLEAQQWACDRITDCLSRYHRDLYEWHKGGWMVPRGVGPMPEREDWAHAPLAGVALCVQDDLVLMRRGERGWHLAAASLCFPSSWNLAEKFGRSMTEIHDPVPLPEKMDQRIERIFDNLQPQLPVWRANWSLDADGELRHDRHERHRAKRHDKLSGTIWFRTEYQTLHKSPNGKDILFTIRIAVSTLEDFLKSAGGREKVAELARQYAAMPQDQLAYKGIEIGAAKFRQWVKENGILANE